MAVSARRSLRLRSRITLFFSITALLASLALSLITYAVARNFLIGQRASVARTQAFSNAKVVADQLSIDALRVGEVFPQLRTEGDGFAVLRLPDTQFITDNRFPDTAIPTELVRQVDQRLSAQQYFGFSGRPYLAVGVYLAASDARYFEAFPLADTDRTLRAIATAMAIGTAVTTLIAAGLGWWTSRRVLRPLTRVATAAGELASGGWDTRLPAESDPDLARLATSFNDMADAVQTRIEREARFASDVSHELRSPITALSAAVEVLDSRRMDLPERARTALDLVVTQVHRFDQMVLDLLELARIDAGSHEMRREAVAARPLLGRIAQRYGFGEVPIVVAGDVPEDIHVDKLRFERILANLLDNARQHGGGPEHVSLANVGVHGVQLTVCDGGLGVPAEETERIFERFARGGAARHRSGTGLGLALVTEHAVAHGGRAWVENLAGGGACFHVVLEECR